MAKKALIGQEVRALRAKARVVEQKVRDQKKLARLDELRPKVFTAFASTFDEKKRGLPALPYAVVCGQAGSRAVGLLPAGPTSRRRPKRGEERHGFRDPSGPRVRGRQRHGDQVPLPQQPARGFSVKIGKYSVDLRPG
jgi:hypothetical protein